MERDDLARQLKESLNRQERTLRSSLILNPVENIPFPEDLQVTAGLLHGLYNSDKVRTRDERMETTTQFAGRTALEADSRLIYRAWADSLGAADATLRFLSGLHAHIVLFMAMSRPGQTVLRLPVEAGGHVSGRAILERLGLNVIEMEVDCARMCVNINRTLEHCSDVLPDFVLIDRSEGLVFEDFSAFGTLGVQTVFDASQYLTNIVCSDHPNPLGWGFDFLIATLHKNFPGPQKALLATREDNARWRQILGEISIYVSNMHVASTYAAGMTLSRSDWLCSYSRRILDLAVLLEAELEALGVPVVRRSPEAVPTHHVWIREESKNRAFETYERLEECLIMTNFRLLPYGLGYGIRLGLSAAGRLGLTKADVPMLAALIAEIRHRGPSQSLQRSAREFNQMIWDRA